MSLNCWRYVFCCDVRNVELYGSSDNSACGFCLFDWVSCKHKDSARLWTTKYTLTALKELSIPRLELMTCLLLSRLMVFVKLAIEKEVSVEKIFFGQLRRLRCSGLKLNELNFFILSLNKFAYNIVYIIL